MAKSITYPTEIPNWPACCRILWGVIPKPSWSQLSHQPTIITIRLWARSGMPAAPSLYRISLKSIKTPRMRSWRNICRKSRSWSSCFKASRLSICPQVQSRQGRPLAQGLSFTNAYCMSRGETRRSMLSWNKSWKTNKASSRLNSNKRGRFRKSWRVCRKCSCWALQTRRTRLSSRR